jgi:hypothetical protein
MNKAYSNNTIKDKKRSSLFCTDWSPPASGFDPENSSLLYHFCPDENRFGNFERLTPMRKNSGKPCNRSNREYFKNIEEVFEFIFKHESLEVTKLFLIISDTEGVLNQQN